VDPHFDNIEAGTGRRPGGRGREDGVAQEGRIVEARVRPARTAGFADDVGVTSSSAGTGATLLVAVAHPDDESFGCGSVLAHAAACGLDAVVLCATRGEAGDSRIDTDDLAAVREGELRAAARILGVTDVRLLGYRDSGMDGTPAPGTLAAADPKVLAGEILAVLEALQPSVVVTLDGSDGHRDHAVIRDATLDAVDALGGGPPSTYLSCLARSSMVRWAERMRAIGGGEAYLALASLGTPDEQITTSVDVAEHLPTRWKAIFAHASQSSPFDDLPEDLQREFLATDRLKLVRGSDTYPR
jgi:N-acetyl-1-D-myo-inositol-2-amino-2-deoxy-alpha-D-glucopyranoside deacetylase